MRLQHLLNKALTGTGTDWQTLERVYGWVHQLADLFFCYQVPDLPRTNNGLEQSFGSERRATGRRGAVPGLVVHGAVRVQAALATRVKTFTAQDLIPHDLHAWRAVRAEIASHQGSRCKQSRFRKYPSAYLAEVERRLLSS